MGIIGVNVPKVSYYESEPWFDNVLRCGPGVREIALDGWRPDAGNIRFDSDGVITHIPNGAVIRHNFGRGYPAGEWVVKYEDNIYDDWKFTTEGAGAPQSGTSFVHSSEKVDVFGEPLKAYLTINVREGQNPSMFSCVTADGRPVTNLRERLNPFRVLRWMDAAQMKQPSLLENWKPLYLDGIEGHASYGIHPQVIANICDEVGATPWINIHWQWDEATIAWYLDHFKKKKAYVEGGNENWNGGYWPGRFFGGDRNAALRHFLPAYRIAHEMGHICILPTQEAGVGGQLGQTKRMINILSQEDLDMFAVIAGKSYFGNGVTYRDAMDDIGNFDLLRSAMDTEKIKIEHMRRYVQDELSKQYAVYECGQSINDPNAARLNRDPRMGELYEEFTRYVAEKTDVACLYNHTFDPSRKYAFGLLEYSGQASSPKWDAVMKVIAEIKPEKPKVDFLKAIQDIRSMADAAADNLIELDDYIQGILDTN